MSVLQMLSKSQCSVMMSLKIRRCSDFLDQSTKVFSVRHWYTDKMTESVQVDILVVSRCVIYSLSIHLY
jgi:hypothetical protein